VFDLRLPPDPGPARQPEGPAGCLTVREASRW
jgi:hypothetical protein